MQAPEHRRTGYLRAEALLCVASAALLGRWVTLLLTVRVAVALLPAVAALLSAVAALPVALLLAVLGLYAGARGDSWPRQQCRRQRIRLYCRARADKCRTSMAKLTCTRQT